MTEISEELREKRREAGRKGGRARVAKGFSADPELARKAQLKSMESRNKNDK